jgi:hypothetical protein
MPRLQSIEWYTFYGCSNLSYINFPELITMGPYVFQGTALTSFSLPKLTRINNDCFPDHFSELYLPKLQLIYDYGFRSMKMLESVYFPELEDLRSGVFLDCIQL